MHVSIVTPAYNASQTIADAIESVLAQTHQDWELIVVDDGSTDSTAKIAGEYAAREPRIRTISRENGGESAARNTGIANARYEWLLFLDADDWISPVHLERMTAELAANPELDAVHCGFVRVALDGTHVPEDWEPPLGDLFPILARRAAFPVHACIVRKSLVENVGKFDTSLRKCPDWDLWQRIARTGARFGAVREVLAYYRMLPNSASLEAEQMLRDGITVIRRGHGPDPRVPNPHPSHASGWPESVESQEFYLLSWCAGLLLGARTDPRHLFEEVGEDHYKLYPDAIAQCVHESGTLPSCESLEAWEKLWPEIQDLAEKFFVALEEHSRTPDLARRSSLELRKLILKHSRTWGAVIAEADEEIARQRRAIEELERNRTALDEQKQKWERLSGELQHEKSALSWDLGQSRQLAKGLEEDKVLLAEGLAQSREREEALARERSALSRDLDQSRQLAKRLEEGKVLLAQGLAQSREREQALEHEKAALSEELEHSRHLEKSLVEDKLLLAGDLAQSREREQALEHEKAALSEELEHSRHLEKSLVEDKLLLAGDLAHSREREQTLEQEKTALSGELEYSQQRENELQVTKAALFHDLEQSHARAEALASELRRWRHCTEEREIALGVMQERLWTRAGLRFGLLAEWELSTFPPNASILSEEKPNETDWVLRVENGSQAKLRLLGSGDVARVEIARAEGKTAWDIQLNHPGQKVKSNGRYAVEFQARADSRRSVGVGLAQAHDPWANLGFYKKLELTPKWQAFREEFVVSADENDARVHFDMGGSRTAIEISSLSLLEIVPSDPALEEAAEIAQAERA